MREVLALRMLLLAWEELYTDSRTSTREQLIDLACQYGESANLQPDEVEAVLVKSVQCIFLPAKEWS